MALPFPEGLEERLLQKMASGDVELYPSFFSCYAILREEDALLSVSLDRHPVREFVYGLVKKEPLAAFTLQAYHPESDVTFASDGSSSSAMAAAYGRCRELADLHEARRKTLGRTSRLAAPLIAEDNLRRLLR